MKRERPRVVDRNAVVKLYQLGLSMHEVATSVGCTFQRVFQILKEEKVPTRRRGAHKKRLGCISLRKLRQIRDLRARGVTFSEIGRVFGTSKQAVHQLLKHWEGFYEEE